MSNFLTQHPEEGVLLRYLDGELAGRKAKHVERHLEACWQCRTEIEELQSTVADCVRYRKNVLEAHLPEPPNAWPDIYREFARVDETLNHEPLFDRLMRPLAAPALRRWALAAAVALAVAGGLFYELRETPAVQAATLLRKAVAAAEARPATARRIRIRTRTQDLMRVVGARRTVAAQPAEPAIAAMFEAAHYDFNDPLSARAYQDWHDAQAQKIDDVTTVTDHESPAQTCYQVRTVAASGDLSEATLMLRASDLRPVEERLQFRNQDWIELTEIAEPANRSDDVSVATNVEVPVRPAEPPSRTVAINPGVTASISDELQVLSALHQIGADLGDPVEVALSGDRVLVSGVGIPPQHQKQIHQLLDPLPNVTVQFSEPAPATLPAEPESAKAPAPPSGSGPAAGLQARLEQHLGSHADFEKFSSQILDWDEAAMSRAYALHKLAQRFPAETEGGLAARDRQVLREMGREHASTMARQVADIERNMASVLVSLGGAYPVRPAVSHSNWQLAAEDLFRVSRRVEVLLSVTLGIAPADAPTASLPSDLLAALRELQANLDDCQRLL